MHWAPADAAQGAAPEPLAVSYFLLLSLWVVAAIALGCLKLCCFCAVESFAAHTLAFKARVLPTVPNSYNWSWSWSRELIGLSVSPSAWCQNYLCIQDHRRLCRLHLPKPSVMISGGFTLYKQLKARTDFWRSWFQIKWVMADVSGSRRAASFWTLPILSCIFCSAALPCWLLPKTHGSAPRALGVWLFLMPI